jgi:3-(3-hydroxy-phenyl)propionate hydroxylase
MMDAPIGLPSGNGSYLTGVFAERGSGFTLLEFMNGAAVDPPNGVATIRIGGEGGFADPAGLAFARYDAKPGTVYLLRPDGYVAARFRHPDRAAMQAALARATGNDRGY